MRMVTIATLGALLLGACGPGASGPAGDGAVNEASATSAVGPAQTNEVSATLPEENVAEASNAAACQSQDGKEIPANRLRATGTEPFWSAAVDGRCVTYSTPENQEGARIWAKFTGTRDSSQWTGFLGKDRFVLTTRPDADCSDGMSDRTYPIAVTVMIGTEERRGCAAPE